MVLILDGSSEPGASLRAFMICLPLKTNELRADRPYWDQLVSAFDNVVDNVFDMSS